LDGSGWRWAYRAVGVLVWVSVTARVARGLFPIAVVGSTIRAVSIAVRVWVSMAVATAAVTSTAVLTVAAALIASERRSAF
jgi:hypothetical protein